jgi:two-component system sensor histidine kinase YesM
MERAVFFRNLPLSTKLFVFSAVIIIIPMVIVGSISYIQSSKILERQVRIHNLRAIEQVEMHIEYYVRDFEISTLKLLNHPDMIRFLRMRTHEEAEQSTIRADIHNLLRVETYSRPDISHITVILDNIRVIDSSGSRSVYPASELKKEYWYDSVPTNGLPLIISRSIDWPDRKEQVISIVRRIHSPNTLQPVGMILIDINFRRLQEVSEKFNIGNRFFYVLDSKGHYVYHPDPDKQGKKAEYPDISAVNENQDGVLVTDGREPRFLTYSHSPNLGWTFVTSVPYAEFRKGAAHIGETITVTVLITLLAAYVLAIAFAATIIGPIRRLQRFMKRVEKGDFREQVAVQSTDEIGQLSAGFNRMVDRLSTLMEEVYFSKLRETEVSLRQKEMEVKVLQSQINPHFLCNSLETIRGMALDKQNEDIATMAASLGALLRYNLRNTSPTVALREEINFCRVYLRIQKFRFEQRFTYEFSIPEWAMPLSIVKFSLQPLVENCLIHSIHVSGEPTHIRISAEMVSEHDFIVCIADTGAGIDPDVLTRLHRDLDEKDVTGGGVSLGIVNVHRRIKHLFGEQYGVKINSTQGAGTQVMVALPMREHVVDGGLGNV